MVSVHLYQHDMGSHSSKTRRGFILDTPRVWSAHPQAFGDEFCAGSAEDCSLLIFILKYITKTSITWQGILIFHLWLIKLICYNDNSGQ